MPLTEVVEFKTSLRGNRIQVPRLVRWQFKLEPGQLLKIEVSLIDCLIIRWEAFYGQMNKDGRITIPYLTRQLLGRQLRDNLALDSVILHVRIKPAYKAVAPSRPK